MSHPPVSNSGPHKVSPDGITTAGAPCERTTVKESRNMHPTPSPSTQPHTTRAAGHKQQPATSLRLVLLLLIAAMFAAGLVVAAPVAAAPDRADAAMSYNPACAGHASDDYGFLDVPAGHTHRVAINCLAHHGVSLGTGDGTVYSPSHTVLRWQMALFMTRAAKVAGVVLPTPADQGFTDLGGKSQSTKDAINQLVAAGLSNGHTATEFKPDDTVTRAQMALFILHLLDKAGEHVTIAGDGTINLVSAGGTPVQVDDFFGDTENVSREVHFAASALFELGVANGTSPGVFAPERPVLRGQMAAFITRALAFTSAQPRADAPKAPGTASVKIAVPTTPPSGSCAYAIPAGPYAWEHCAWREHLEDRDHNSVVTDEEAKTLAEKIWAEVDTPGKPSAPPSMEIVPSGTECASVDVVGCYIPSDHHIRRLDAFNRVFLHELAHALIADSTDMDVCRTAANYNQCVHGDLFRCVANHLYVTYADLADAGVCGTAVDLGASNYVTWRTASRSEVDPLTLDTTSFEWAILRATEVDSSEVKFPWNVTLQVRCRDNEELDVYLHTRNTHLAGLEDRTSPYRGKIPVSYRFGNRTGVVSEHWSRSTNVEMNEYAFLSDGRFPQFFNLLFSSEGEEIVFRVFDSSDLELGTFTFVSYGADNNLRPVIEACGYDVNVANLEVYPRWKHRRSTDVDIYTYEVTDYSSASLPAIRHTRRRPFQHDQAWITVQCRNQSTLEAYFRIETGRIDQIEDLSSPHFGLISVTYRIGDDSGVISQHWLPSEDSVNRSVFAPADAVQQFVDKLLASEGEEIVFKVWNEGNTEFGSFFFVSLAVEESVHGVLEACGR